MAENISSDSSTLIVIISIITAEVVFSELI